MDRRHRKARLDLATPTQVVAVLGRHMDLAQVDHKLAHVHAHVLEVMALPFPIPTAEDFQKQVHVHARIPQVVDHGVLMDLAAEDMKLELEVVVAGGVMAQV